MRRPIRVPEWPASEPRPRGATRRVVHHGKGTSELEELLYLHLVGAGLHHGCVRQHLYVPGRRFTADFAWPDQRLLVECQGGVWSRKSGHSGGSGITKDIERGNAATLAGWRVLRFAPAHIRSGEALRVIAEALGRRGQ